MSVDDEGVRADEIQWAAFTEPTPEYTAIPTVTTGALGWAVADILALEARIASLEGDNRTLRELVSECLACVHTVTIQLERARAARRMATE